MSDNGFLVLVASINCVPRTRAFFVGLPAIIVRKIHVAPPCAIQGAHLYAVWQIRYEPEQSQRIVRLTEHSSE